MDIASVKSLSRFYYSLLVSVRMFRKEGNNFTLKGRKRHISGWLNQAKNRKLFSRVVFQDIEWLMIQNQKLHPDVMERQLLKIYRTSRFICLTAGVRTFKYIMNE
ncbi:hypothetical protein [Pantoea rwandensis]|uniref:Uncharacterized protein n=1 Tax=Pantoea rwandensis TaxID=1076550 RepID=A0A1X1D3R6_9GAMM|nr:hypothetical protein [Pantoea rwandensis]ORM71171.1 hypothetical protein HA51_04645 [Pantoea rwandensis]